MIRIAAIGLLLAVPAFADTVNLDLRPDAQGRYTYTPPAAATGNGYVIELHDTNGRLRARIHNTAPRLHEGDRQGETVWWDVDGNIATRIPFKDGLKDGVERHFFPDGTVASEITFRSGRPDGPTRHYYASGQLKEEQILKSARTEGVERTYHENGQLASDSRWRTGRRDGPFHEYDRDGHLIGEGRYAMGRRAGSQIDYWPSGDMRAKRHFRHGREVGTSQRWSRAGDLTRQTEFTDAGVFKRERRWKNGDLGYLREPVRVEGHGAGEKIAEYNGNFTETDIQAENYRLVTRHRNAELIDRSEVIDGQMQGLYIGTDPIQNDTTRFRYVDNQPDGLFTRTWNGRVLDRGMYDHGKRIGPWRIEKTPPLVEFRNYDAEGRLDGEQLTLDINKDVRMRASYKAGTLDGPFESHGPRGTVLEQGRYDNGEKIGPWIEIVPSLNDSWHGTYRNGKRDGRWNLDDVDGHRVEVVEYTMGAKDGLHYLFAPDGAVDEVQAWRDNVRDGYTTYFEQGHPARRDLWRDGSLIEYGLQVPAQ